MKTQRLWNDTLEGIALAMAGTTVGVIIGFSIIAVIRGLGL